MNMYDIPKEPKKIRARIRSYERKLRHEKLMYGQIGDGAGKRFFLGPLYLLMNDLEGALDSFRWFEEEFPDDGGDPGHRLCWALALYLSGDLDAASRKLKQAVLTNLYLVPHLVGQDIDKIDMWHGSNLAEPEYLRWIPDEYFSLWDDKPKKWASGIYYSKDFQAMLGRYIQIQRQLKDLPPGIERSLLVDESYALIKDYWP